jgi:hypothetical protein
MIAAQHSMTTTIASCSSSSSSSGVIIVDDIQNSRVIVGDVLVLVRFREE